MRSTTNLLIINLAAADILFVIFCVPFTATDYIFTEWPFGDLWCKYVSAASRRFHHPKFRSKITSYTDGWFPIAGTIYDSGYVPCERVYIGFNVIRSVFGCCASSDQHVIANGTQCYIVSTHFYANYLHGCSQICSNICNHWLNWFSAHTNTHENNCWPSTLAK